MAPDDHSGARPVGPVVLRIKLRYEDLDAMVQRFAINVGRSGLFLPTRSLQPIGTEIRFELRLANDVPVLVGLGRVKYVKPPDPDNPRASFGLSLELMRVSREGREVIIRMIERRRQLGLPEVAIPIPDDVESSRRYDVDTQPRVDSASLVPVLAPEPERQRRRRVSELIQQASERSGAIAAATTVPELDQQVDVERALARARALAGGDLDVELAALREDAAAPLGEISVEAASAELARQLGGKPISKRERSARWATPPAVETPTLVTQAIADEVALAALQSQPQPQPAPQLQPDPQPEPAPQLQPQPQPEPQPERQPELQTEPEDQLQPDAEPDAQSQSSPSIVPTESYVLRKSERVDAPYVETYEGEGYGRTTDYGVEEETRVPPGDEPAPEQKPGMMIDDDSDLAAFEAALDAARIHTGVSTQPAPPADDDPDEDPDELLAAPTRARKSETDLLMEHLDEQLEEAEDEEGDFADRRKAEPDDEDVDEEDIEELDDMDVMSIDDDDLIEESDPVPAAAAPPDDDFASRLALDDDDAITPPPRMPYDPVAAFGRPRRSEPDLERALSALDVDLDPSLQPKRGGSRPLPGLPVHRTGEVPTVQPGRAHTVSRNKPPTDSQPVVKPKRAMTDDGIMIDFDDDE